MGDRTQLERVIELEAGVRVILEELAKVKLCAEGVALWVEAEEIKRKKVSEKMKKARAGCGKAKK